MKKETIILGGGCFWCVEAVYRRLDGIVDLESGYAGGSVADPTYRQICTGETGHAEVVRITWDADVISLAEIIDFFWKAHDPTTLNRQGADVGTQYRSVIFYDTDGQKEIIEASRNRAQEHFTQPIVTEIVPAATFYPAEEYHQDYYELNPRQGYCRMVIEPKLKKLGFDSATIR
jgi:peptide-methionine (S)-S-oxide reductase